VPLSHLEQTVAKKAQAEADAILSESRQKADALWEKESTLLREEHQRRMAALEAQLGAELDRQTGDHEAQNRLRLLGVKNEIIESVFRAAAEGVRKLPNDGYKRWLQDQLLRLPADQPLQVTANAADLSIVAQIVKDIGRPNLTVASEAVPLAGGFVARGGRNDLDFSIEAVMSVLRESLAEDVAARLFREETS
jgi:vacuolar-type H+-ATPase subunit E/Vma4